MMNNLTGKRVVIIGAARQGQALARYLVRHGAQVTLNDRRSIEDLRAAQAALMDLNVNWITGGHPLEMLDEADLLCLSGGIPLNIPIVIEAQRRGIPLSNDTQIFLQAVPCKTIGITGSAGKTTTTSLVGHMAQEAFEAQSTNVWIGGNIGDPLINYVDDMKVDDLAIMEISSFQLEQMSISPQIAVVLNITPNHLDRHNTMEAYTAAKARILEFQRPEDTAVLCRDDAGSWNLRDKVQGRLISFGFRQIDESEEGTFIQASHLYLREKNVDIPLMLEDAIHLRGEHNRMNVLAACAIGFAAGFPLDSMLAAIQEFRGVPHRLEFVREWKGSVWYNDSIATAPERTMAAIRSFKEPLVLLLGGRDKNLPWEDLAEMVHSRVDHVVLFGEAAEKIAAALGSVRDGKRPFSINRCKGLKDAVELAARIVEPGDIVLFSPGGTSFDEFRDFEERGESFRTWVLELS
jgi:UDP-N-acetylmuramoylalanine--D-glutamate ligase